jgi:hypothetical protein
MMKKEKKINNIEVYGKENNKDNVILIPLLQKITNECTKSLDMTVEFNHLSMGLIKKIKYLLYLFQKKD